MKNVEKIRYLSGTVLVFAAAAVMVMLSFMLFPAPHHITVPAPMPDEVPAPRVQVGTASWYDYGLAGAPDYAQSHLTAASRDFPRGTMLEVCRTDADACVAVRVNDYVENPNVIIDLSPAAFRGLAPLSRGLVPVAVSVIRAVPL